jgi:hypothetical protein
VVVELFSTAWGAAVVASVFIDALASLPVIENTCQSRRNSDVCPEEYEGHTRSIASRVMVGDIDLDGIGASGGGIVVHNSVLAGRRVHCTVAMEN